MAAPDLYERGGMYLIAAPVVRLIFGVLAAAGLSTYVGWLRQAQHRRRPITHVVRGDPLLQIVSICEG